jgi:hypothetical protein
VESHCVDDSFSRLGEAWCGAGDSLRLDGIRERFELMNMCSGLRMWRVFWHSARLAERDGGAGWRVGHQLDGASSWLLGLPPGRFENLKEEEAQVLDIASST